MSLDLEQDAQWLIDGLSSIWERQWTMRDICKGLVDSRPADWIRALREPSGISETKIRRWAEEAELVPPADRAEDVSPQRQIHIARRRLRESQG